MVLVAGVGAVVEPVPPVACVYQSKLVPVALRGEAISLLQYCTVGKAVGEAGAGLIVIDVLLLAAG